MHISELVPPAFRKPRFIRRWARLSPRHWQAALEHQLQQTTGTVPSPDKQLNLAEAEKATSPRPEAQ